MASSAHWNYTPNWNAQTRDGWNLEDLSITADNGQLRDNFVVRPYALATAGEPHSLSVGSTTLQYRWRHDPAKGDTELFVPPAWWLAGVHYQLLTVPEQQGACRRQGHKLVCRLTEPADVMLSLEQKN